MRWWELEGLAIEEVAENLLLGGPFFGNLLTHPSDIHIVLHADVLARDVATPGTTAEARRHWHSVVERSRIPTNLRLAHHDAANRRHQREAMNVLFIERVDPAGVSFAADFQDLCD